MDREEAIKVYHELLNERIKEAFEFFAPDLKESEDERIRKHIIEILKRLSPCHWDGNEKSECIAYLEKQKEQKPAEWSEEDLQHKSWILECLADGKRTMPQYAADFHAAYNWLKSLRPQPHWKPSEEQIDALERAIVKMHSVNDIDILAELRDNLKKLI